MNEAIQFLELAERFDSLTITNWTATWAKFVDETPCEGGIKSTESISYYSIIPDEVAILTADGSLTTAIKLGSTSKSMMEKLRGAHLRRACGNPQLYLCYLCGAAQRVSCERGHVGSLGVPH